MSEIDHSKFATALTLAIRSILPFAKRDVEGLMSEDGLELSDATKLAKKDVSRAQQLADQASEQGIITDDLETDAYDDDFKITFEE